MKLRDDCLPFWRDITLRTSEGRVDAEIVDNVHHFVVTIHHDGDMVTDVTGHAIRVPWITCPGAVGQLSQLNGTSVAMGSRVLVDQSQQCTHMLDLARVAIAQVGRGGMRRYQANIHYDERREVVVAQLERDRALLLDWVLKDGLVLSPGPFEGHFTEGRSFWSDAVRSDPDLVEAGLILRRAIYVFRSRRYSAPRHRAADTPGMSGVCYSFQPERAERAYRPADFVELP
ncbi:DUF2889 domain-containing protein [Sphingobium aquiterrae]|uniref:DUF2889 domain-containing protein n=1 Tax=Sphingobium aquiterrae TaxID=2038656 RepID=UPI003018FD44